MYRNRIVRLSLLKFIYNCFNLLVERIFIWILIELCKCGELVVYYWLVLRLIYVG